MGEGGGETTTPSNQPTTYFLSLFWKQFPFHFKVTFRAKVKKLFYSSIFKLHHQLHLRKGLFDLIWRAVNAHVLSIEVRVMLHSKLPHPRAVNWSLGLMVCV